MTGRREIVFLVFVVVILIGGVAFDLLSSDVSRQSPGLAEGERFESRAVFCPPASGKAKANTYFTVASGTGEDTVVGTSSSADDPADLAADQILSFHSEQSDALDIVGFGSTVVASGISARDDPSGAGAAQCASEASERWYFAAGSSSIDVTEKILIYNPFPDEAVVSLGAITPRGDRAMTALRDLAVPAKEWRTILFSDVVQVKDTIAVEIETRRGRVVAWRETTAFGKDVTKGIEFDLGAPAPEMQWYFPDGAAGEGAEETISLLNPGDQEAVVSVILATPEETLTPPDLVEFVVPPRTQRVISIGDFAGKKKSELISVSAIVTSLNGQPVIAERTVTLDTEDLSGRSSELGATETSQAWFLGPAARAPSGDAVVVMAPGAEDVTVDLTILSEEGTPLAPAELQGLEITAGSRIKVAIGEWTRGEMMGVIVSSDQVVVAERFSYSEGAADITALMGQPIKMLP